MKILIIVLALTVSLILGVIGFAYSGIYDVGAASPHSGFSNWLLSTTSKASIARRAIDIDVPDLSDVAMVNAGINDFDAMCSGCHGAPGKPPEAMGQGLNPPAPDLVESAAGMSPSELFWVTKHGIRMTGMPAWGATHDDSALWPVVAFMSALPGMSGDDYQALLAGAAGAGHHAPDETHDDDGDSGDPEEQGSAETEPKADDHSTHTHEH